MTTSVAGAGSPSQYPGVRSAPETSGYQRVHPAAVTSPYLRRQPVQNFLLVRERDRRRLRELRLLVFAVVPAALALLAYVWVQTEIVRTGYQVRALERQLEEMAREERRMRLEASRLESLERVERAAAEELGMTFPTLEQMVFVGVSVPPGGVNGSAR